MLQRRLMFGRIFTVVSFALLSRLIGFARHHSLGARSVEDGFR